MEHNEKFGTMTEKEKMQPSYFLEELEEESIEN